MILAATQAEAAERRRHYTSPHGAQAVVDTYIGTNKALQDAPPQSHDATRLEPTAYIVAQAPGGELHPHFHQADQFQVIVQGSGRIGTHAVRALAVHYAAAHSPYGPVVAGPEGLHYLTLRRQWDPGAQWMPESAPALRGMPGRQHVVLTSESIPLDTAPVAERDVVELLKHGSMRAWLVQLAPDAARSLEGQGDRFVHVLSGDVEVFGKHHIEAGACLFASDDEAPVILGAGRHGARAVIVRFP